MPTAYRSILVVDTGNDPNRPRPGRDWLKKRYRVHQRLWMAFDAPASHTQGNDRPFLFRIEPACQIIEVRSTVAPDWQRAFENSGFLIRRALGPDSLALEYKTGQEFNFSLLANPTKKKRHFDPAKKNGTRLGLRTDEELDAIAGIVQEEHGEAAAAEYLARKGEVARWFARKAEAGGFESLGWTAHREPRVVDRKIPWNMEDEGARDDKKTKDIMRFDALEFQGILRVTDPDLFAAAMINGIGSGKGLGFGMLCIGKV